MNRVLDPEPAWNVTELKRPAYLVAALAGLTISVPASAVTSCNVHELGHVLVAAPLGWEVERIHFCLPRGGAVEYASVGRWAGNAQGYAGGFIAALFLAAVYLAVFVVPRRPLRSAFWWAAGVGPVVWIGPQVMLGFLEGTTGRGQDYTEVLSDNRGLYVLLAATIAAGVAGHAWRWRRVWRSHY